MYDSNLDWCLKLGILVGVHPGKQKNILPYFQFLFITLGGIVIMILTVMMLHYKEDAIVMKDITDVSVNFTMFPHGILKMSNLFLKRRDVLDLLQMTKTHFWKPEGDEKTNPSLRTAKFLKTLLINSVMLFIIAAIAKPILLDKHILLGGDALTYKCFLPQWFPRYLFLIFEDVVGVAILLTITCNDVIILTLLMLAQNQFRMLNEKIRNIYTFGEDEDQIYDESVIRRRVKECVDHRNVLKDFLNRFSDIFSKTTFLFVGNITLSLCLAMYVITTETSNINVQLEAFFHVIAGLNEICLCFSIPAQEMMNEADKIGNSVYFSEWYEYPEHADNALMMLTHERKRIVFTAGGVVRIDMEMFLTTCKSIISYCMFLRTMSMLEQ